MKKVDSIPLFIVYEMVIIIQHAITPFKIVYNYYMAGVVAKCPPNAYYILKSCRKAKRNWRAGGK